MKPAKTILTLVFLTGVLILAKRDTVEAVISVSDYPGGLHIATCNDPKDIFDPSDPLGRGEVSAGLFCLTGISFKLLYNAIILFGIAFFVVLLIGGLRYLTAAGDEKSMQTARKTLTYGVMGIGIALGSVFIMIVIVGNVLQPVEMELNSAGEVVSKGTPDPFHVLIPDYFCTREGITDPSVRKSYCGNK